VTDHFVALGNAFDFLDRSELDKFFVGSRRRMAERTNAFGDDVEQFTFFFTRFLTKY